MFPIPRNCYASASYRNGPAQLAGFPRFVGGIEVVRAYVSATEVRDLKVAEVQPLDDQARQVLGAEVA